MGRACQIAAVAGVVRGFFMRAVFRAGDGDGQIIYNIYTSAHHAGMTSLSTSAAERKRWVQSSFTKEELVACGHGLLFGSGNAQLPIDQMLMVDRITRITANGGAYGKGEIVAELDIHPNLWFFKCHFMGDPVMPGCLGLDSLWQMLGFFLGWTGAPGSGRALGLAQLKFTGQILPETKRVDYRVDIKRVINRRLVLGVADGEVRADGERIYQATDLQVGLFENPNSIRA